MLNSAKNTWHNLTYSSSYDSSHSSYQILLYLIANDLGRDSQLNLPFHQAKAPDFEDKLLRAFALLER